MIRSFWRTCIYAFIGAYPANPLQTASKSLLIKIACLLMWFFGSFYNIRTDRFGKLLHQNGKSWRKPYKYAFCGKLKMYYKELLQNLRKKGLSKQQFFLKRFVGYSLTQNCLKSCAFCVCFPDENSSWISLCVFGSKALRISGHSKAAQTKNVCAARIFCGRSEKHRQISVLPSGRAPFRCRAKNREVAQIA